MSTEEPPREIPSEALHRAKRAAIEACEPLQSLQRTLAADEDIDTTDVVREAEYAAEETIRTTILGRDESPAHTLRFEEDVVYKSDEGYSWIVDPLDGTDSFRDGDDEYAVSIALYDDRGPVLGAVAAPARGKLFSAVHGDETMTCEELPGAEIDDSNREGRGWADCLEEATLVTGYDCGGRFHRQFAGRAARLRRRSSAALNLCELADKEVDGHWEFDTYPWDVAGGLVIARAAGAIVTNPMPIEAGDGIGTGPEADNFEPGREPRNERVPLVASNEAIHDTLVETVAEMRARQSE